MPFRFSYYTRAFILLLALAPALGRAQENARPAPLVNAHAHNDYAHARPLLDALDHGFCSVEADIHLVDGKLLVAHDRDQVRADRTLEALYLEPLRERAMANAGRVYPGGPTFTLLIDIKSDGAATYEVLREILAEYDEILSGMDIGEFNEGAVTVVISGSRPMRMIEADPTRRAGIDGRVSDLDSELPAHLMPLISNSWGSEFKWRGVGPMPEAEREKLRKIVERAHAKGRRVRFWATPERENVWQEMLDAGVDLINTDRLARLQAFLLSKAP